MGLYFVNVAWVSLFWTDLERARIATAYINLRIHTASSAGLMSFSEYVYLFPSKHFT